MEVGAVLKRETGVQVNKMLIIPNCRLTCLHYVNFLPQCGIETRNWRAS